jgi:hypothetical protein
MWVVPLEDGKTLGLFKTKQASINSYWIWRNKATVDPVDTQTAIQWHTFDLLKSS